MAKKVMMEGNEALAESALRAGMEFFAGYPITPQTEITEYLSHRMDEVTDEGDKGNRVFVQAESELAVINMCLGAAVTGHRAMTATSAPGFSLMQEGISWAAGANTPLVVVDVGRGGAGNSNVQPAQADYNLATKTIGHGGFRAFVLAPSTVQETADFTYEAFDIAEKYRTVVYIMTDGQLAHMLEPVEFKPFRELSDIPEKTYCVTGKKPGQERKAFGWHLKPNGDEIVSKEHEQMYADWAENEARWEEFMMDDAETVIVAWGTCARTAKTAVRELRAKGEKVGLLRAITLHPFPTKVIRAIDETRVKNILVLENTIPAQFYYDVKLALEGKPVRLSRYTRGNGNLVTQEEAIAAYENLK